MSMTDRDRLAADLLDVGVEWVVTKSEGNWHLWTADRLIALGWTRLDEERLAREMHRAQCDLVWYTDAGDLSVREDMQRHREDAAAIAKAYREDEG